MTKQEAADFLGVKHRTLELYASKGRVSVNYVKGTRGNIAQYDEMELENLKRELGQETAYPQRGMLAKPDATITSIATNGQAGEIRDLLSVIAERLKPNSEVRPLTDLAVKLTLSLAEASQLSGLSRNFLGEAIHSKKLKAGKRGRGWNIKRADLDAYVKTL